MKLIYCHGNLAQSKRLYRDGSKLSQPLASKLVDEDVEEEIEQSDNQIDRTIAVAKEAMNSVVYGSRNKVPIGEKDTFKKLLRP